MGDLNKLILSAEQRKTVRNAEKRKKNSDDDNRIRERKTPADDRIK